MLTDAGSTKGAIVATLEEHLPSGIAFVGSHPLAGSEKRGPEHADAGLFEGRWTVVTRTPRTDAAALQKTVTFWQALGARVKIMTPDDHDRALALTSHLPHLIAAALVGMVPAELSDLTATGFRDTTRIAAGDAGLWTAIFSHNRDAVLEALDSLDGRLDEFRKALENRDWTSMEAHLARAKQVRDALGT